MTIDVNAAGVLAQVYAVAILILALEGRFLRIWHGSRRIFVLRVVVTAVGFLSLILTLMAENALVQAVIFNQEVSESLTILVIVAGWSLSFAVAAFLGGAMTESTFGRPPQK